MNAQNELAGYLDRVIEGEAWASSGTEAARHIEEQLGWSKPRTVDSIEEVEALPDGSAILTGGEVAIALTDCNQPVRVWDTGDGVQCTSHFLALPATVLFTPGGEG